MAKLVVIVAERGFDESALRTLSKLLGERGVELVVAAAGPKAVGQFTIRYPKLRVADVRLTDYDGVLVLGGDGARSLWGNKEAMQVVRGAVLERKLVGALGPAVAIPAQATVLAFQDVACDPEPDILAELAKHHARWVPVRVAESTTGVITAPSDALEEFCHLVCDRLGARVSAQPNA